MYWLIGDWQHLGMVATKAALMYATALIGLRLGERRTLAQWTIIDFATSVAMGAIIGRSALASTQSYVTGAAALLTLVAVHRAAARMRFSPVLGKLVDHRVRVLVAHGEVRRSELHRCGLTDEDLSRELRQRGVFAVEGLRYVLYETKGSITVVPEEATSDGEPPLVRAGLEGAARWP